MSIGFSQVAVFRRWIEGSLMTYEHYGQNVYLVSLIIQDGKAILQRKTCRNFYI